MIGQAVNLANAAWLIGPAKKEEKDLQEYFDFYFAFLQKQYDKVFLKPEKEIDRKEIYKKELDNEHIENMNWD